MFGTFDYETDSMYWNEAQELHKADRELPQVKYRLHAVFPRSNMAADGQAGWFRDSFSGWLV